MVSQRELINQLIEKNQARSIQVYLKLQQLEMLRQQAIVEIQEVSKELILLDGEMRVLSLLKDSGLED